mgnify:CR=1 FL=1
MILIFYLCILIFYYHKKDAIQINDVRVNVMSFFNKVKLNILLIINYLLKYYYS